MATTRSGSKSPSPAKKVSKKSKKAPTVTSKVEPKMGLKKIAKNLVADVPETSGTKKRAPPVKVDAPKTKRAKISKSARDVSFSLLFLNFSLVFFWLFYFWCYI